MTIALTQSFTAVAANITSSFLAIGGIAPYTYSVIAGGAGGTIASNGVYTAPAIASSSPNQIYDTIQAVDSVGAIATSQILVGTPLMLLCDIIQTGMNLPNGRVYLWDQKINQPSDYGLYIAISNPSCRPFANINEYVSTNNGLSSSQAVNMMGLIDIDIISRGPEARDQKEGVILSLYSNYSESQQLANSFFIGRISKSFLNLSQVDGAAIPYRYKISCQMQYMYTSMQAVPYFDKFSGFTVTTNN